MTGGLPLGRDPHLALAVTAPASDPNPADVRAADCAQIGLQLTGHAQCVATGLRQRIETLPADRKLRPLTRVALRESVNSLSTGPG
ncbi:hypothetical protein [Streptomyces sp. NPDC088719]|uniref:hypothetical protein n=1 Tax=Streptomyces sp. NPDC088719 TaxID=3365872 RepID=UPI0038216318